MKHRFTFTLLSFLLITGILLSACTPASPTSAPQPTAVPPTDAPAAAQPVTIQVMSFFAYDNPEVEEAVVAAFEAKHPEIKVDFQAVSFADIFNVYKTRAAGNEAPDVMAMNYDNSYQFASLGALEPLDDWIENTSLDTTIYYQATLDMFKVNGVQYAMPATFSDVVMYYNKDLFDAAGVEYPQPDWTMEDVKKAATALTKDTDGDGTVDQWGYTFPWWPVVLEMYNGKLWSADQKTCTLNSAEGIKAIQTIVDGRYTDQYAPTADALAQQGDWDMFKAGKLAMFPTGPWAVQPFNDEITSFKWDIAHMPAGDRHATHVYANSYAMSAASKNKAAAWEFMVFATGPEGTKIRQAGKYEISPVKEIAETYYVEALKGSPPEHSIVFMEVQDYAVPQPVHAHWQEIWDSVAPEVDLALSNSKPVKEALDAACEAANPVLNQ